MKLRFGIDEAAYDRIRAQLDANCAEPPVGRRLTYVYLDTPEGALADHGAALRFRRVTAVGLASPDRPWKRQVVWSGAGGKSRSLKKLGITRLRQRLDASFSVRIERWTWQWAEGWAAISLDRSRVSTGSRHEDFGELRLVCRRKRGDDAMQLAVELGAMHLASRRARERGLALLVSDEGGRPTTATGAA